MSSKKSRKRVAKSVKKSRKRVSKSRRKVAKYVKKSRRRVVKSVKRVRKIIDGNELPTPYDILCGKILKKIKEKLPKKYSQHTEDRVDEFYLGSKKYLVYVNSDFNYITIGPVNGGYNAIERESVYYDDKDDTFIVDDTKLNKLIDNFVKLYKKYD